MIRVTAPQGKIAAAGALFATVLGAGVVSALQESPRLAAACLASFALAYVLRAGLVPLRGRRVATDSFMLFTTGFLGYLTESWGTSNGHWTYEHLPPGQNLPAWVPLAWALAGVLLHEVDTRVPKPGTSGFRRLQFAILSGLALPFLGEAICVAMGVWTYHWPLQILGVPLLALLLLAYVHVTLILAWHGLERALAPEGS